MTELYHSVKSFNEELYICVTCHKHLNKNKNSCQAVCNKMTLDPISDELKNIEKIRKHFNFQKNLFQKIAKIHGKDEFSKIKGIIFNVPRKTGNK